MFGGFTSPTDAIPVYEMIVKYAPASDLAPKSQFQIGEIYRSEGNLFEAVSAYDTVLFRYPQSLEAEKSAFGKSRNFDEN